MDMQQQEYPEFPGGGSYHLQGPIVPIPGVRCDARMHYSTRTFTNCAKDRPNLIIIDPNYGDGDPIRWPEQDQDMTLLARSHDKHVLWRRTAGDWLAKDLGLYDEHEAAYWIIDDLPKNYGLFEQVTHPKEKKEVMGKQRLDRFIFGHDGRKIRSALSLGKHIAWLLTGGYELCACDGCKIVSKAGVTAVPGQPRTSHHAHGRPRPQTKKRGRGSTGGAGGSVGPGGSEMGDTDEDDWDGTSAKRKKKKAAANSARRASNRPQTMWVSESTANARAGIIKGRQWEYDSEDEFIADPRDIRDYEQESEDTITGPVDESYASFDSRRAIDLDSHNAAMDAYVQALLAAYDSDMTPAFVEQRLNDLDMPTLCRVGELVWCRIPSRIQHVEPEPEVAGASQQRHFTHWPGMVTARVTDATSTAYNISMLGIKEEETLVGVPQLDVLPWLGFVPFAIDPKDIEDSLTEAKNALGNEVKARVSLDEIEKGGFSVLKTLWLAACEAGRYLSGVQVRTLPELSTGPHLVPNPNAAPDSTPLRALYMSRPDSRYITYPHLYFGPELLHSGDVLRLIPNVELPPSVARHVVEKPPTSLRTCLVVLLDCFIRGGKDAPLLARGRIYEMNEIDESAAGVAQDMLIAQRNSALPLDAQAEDAAALSRMPSAFPGHKWRNLAPGRLIDVLLSHVAGRFYSPPEDVQDDDALVNVIAEKARRTGVIGEEGTRAVGLLLGGMVSGARVPKITAPTGVLGLAEGNSQRDCQARLTVADEQGFIAVGLYMPPTPDLDIALEDIKYEVNDDFNKAFPSSAAVSDSGMGLATMPLPDLAQSLGLNGDASGSGSNNGSVRSGGDSALDPALGVEDEDELL